MNGTEFGDLYQLLINGLMATATTTFSPDAPLQPPPPPPPSGLVPTDDVHVGPRSDESNSPPDVTPFLLKVVVPSVYGLISVVGIVGNALVVYVILSKRQMRTVTNVLLLNLAFADLCFLVVVPPVTAYAMSTWPHWRLGGATCKLTHYVVNVTAYVTVYTLVLVSVVRYMTVVHGTTTARLRTISNVVAMIVCIWIVMAAVNGPLLAAYDVSAPAYITDSVECTSGEMARYVFVLFFAFAYVIPLTVIGVFSLCILRYITRHRGGLTSATTTTLDSGANARSTARKRQASRLLILVVAIFAALWLPLHVHLIAVHFGWIYDDNKLYNAVSLLWPMLAYSNSCVNPFIYDHMSKDFRDAFREVMHCSNSSLAGGGPDDADGNGHDARNRRVGGGTRRHQQQQQQQQQQLLVPVAAKQLLPAVADDDTAAKTTAAAAAAVATALQMRVEHNGCGENYRHVECIELVVAATASDAAANGNVSGQSAL